MDLIPLRTILPICALFSTCGMHDHAPAHGRLGVMRARQVRPRPVARGRARARTRRSPLIFVRPRRLSTLDTVESAALMIRSPLISLQSLRSLTSEALSMRTGPGHGPFWPPSFSRPWWRGACACAASRDAWQGCPGAAEPQPRSKRSAAQRCARPAAPSVPGGGGGGGTMGTKRPAGSPGREARGARPISQSEWPWGPGDRGRRHAWTGRIHTVVWAVCARVEGRGHMAAHWRARWERARSAERAGRASRTPVCSPA